jgi:hypothetical protein
LSKLFYNFVLDILPLSIYCPYCRGRAEPKTSQSKTKEATIVGNARVVKADVMASNGVIHVIRPIDSVLLPS